MHTNARSRLLIVASTPEFVRVFLSDQIRMLADGGFDVLLVCSPPAAGEDLGGELGCAVVTVPIARSIDLVKDVLALFRLLAIMLRFRPGVVHSHSPKAGLLGSIAAWLAGVRVRFHTIHGLRSECMRGNRRRLMRAMERLTAACSTQCFAVSRSLQRKIVEEGLCAAEKIMVLGDGSWAGIPIAQFNPLHHSEAGAMFRAARGLERNSLVVTCIGRIAADKGITTLVDAWQEFKQHTPEARLVVAGPLDATDPVPAATLGILRDDESIVLIDHFVDDIFPLLAASDIFVQPSLREGLGIAALEASAMELPVVASRVTGLVDAVRDERSGILVPPSDAGALAFALERLARSPDFRRELGLEGRRFAEMHFDRRQVLARSLHMYREVTAHAAPGAIGKRLFDLLVAGTLFCLTLPIHAALAVCVACFMGRPVFFKQQRAGLHGRPFDVMKFRTMCQPAKGQAMIGTDHQRSHWFGDWMRRLSLDELPQLLNVVRGEMSLVGPRPLLLDYLPRYSHEEARRHEVLPGITGWAQVNGRNAISWEQKFAHDLWYVEHRSFSLDLRILLRTAERVVRSTDTAGPGPSGMPEFLGSSTLTPHS